MTLLQRVARLFGCRALDTREIDALLIAHRRRRERTTQAADEAADVIGEFVHGLNADTQRDIARRDG